jgi:hypothetical protein
MGRGSVKLGTERIVRLAFDARTVASRLKNESVIVMFGVGSVVWHFPADVPLEQTKIPGHLMISSLS